MVLQPRSCRNNYGLGSSVFARHYLRNHSYFLFLRVLRCFSSPGLLTYSVTILHIAGLPHSEICGSPRMCQSPQLIAAYHVFLRLWEPRHPPYALSNFLKKSFTLYSYLSTLVSSLTIMSKNFILVVSCWLLVDGIHLPTMQKSPKFSSKDLLSLLKYNLLN